MTQVAKQKIADKDKIQRYINNFRRRLTPLLKPGIGLYCKIIPAGDKGAILEFIIKPEIENDDFYMPEEPSMSQALSKVKQNAFGGNLAGFSFRGTNFILEGNRIILIKDNSALTWSDKTAQEDISRLLSGLKGKK